MHWLGSDTEAWRRYWQARQRAWDCRDSDGRYLQPIRQRWHDFFDRLEARGRVLHLGFGNGAVPLEVLRGSRPARELSIETVNCAGIGPAGDPSQTRDEQDMWRINGRTLPFGKGSMDAVTAQFVLEFMPLADWAPEWARVARSGARFRAILHVRDGVCDHLATMDLKEIRTLLDSTIFAQAGRAAIEPGWMARWHHTAADLTGRLSPTSTLTPLVLNLLKRLIGQGARQDAATVLTAIDALLDELQQYRSRLRALHHAAVDGPRQQVIASTLGQAGFSPVHFSAIRMPGIDALLALQLDTRAA